jgi:hypothetical protein
MEKYESQLGRIIPYIMENMKVRLDHHPNYYGKSKPCLKPPTRVNEV